MAENIPLEFNDGGSLKKLNTEASNIKGNLEGAAAASKRIAGPVAAARQGVANKNAAAGGQVAEDSNMARGVGGLTGAAGRDFAAQAKGLGGLVHVYASLAANIFAVSAAYNALSKAANVANMVKGLDQLGAAAGRNLGSLAKGLTKVSDGALSLSDSLTAVAQASSGGMSGENIIRMGEVAKKASQALGRDMSDAINRLSRGITKIEPELLDELGIMVKVDEASRNYARTLGKTSSSLSDFEKRQGYANAVLEEGERKFGSIKLDSSPYQKILASVSDLLLKGGELINKVLGPMLDYLSSSPTALAAALGLFATTLLRQAIPALTQMREGMEAASTKAREAAIEANKQRTATRGGMIHSAIVESEARVVKSIENLDLAKKKLDGLKKTALTSRLVEGTDFINTSEAQVAALEKQAVTRGKLKILDADASTRSKNAALAAQAEATAIKEVTMALREKMLAEKADSVLDKGVKTGTRIGGPLGNDAVRDRIADRLVAKSQQATILGKVASDLPIKGMTQSFASLWDQVNKARAGQDALGNAFESGTKKMGFFNGVMTLTKGSLAIITSSITALAMSLTNVFIVVGIAVAVFQALDSLFSTATKEAEAFTSALNTMGEAVDNVNRTLETISEKGFEKVFTTESIQAKATAFDELTSSIGKGIKGFEKLEKASSPWEKGWDWIKDKLPLVDSASEKLVKQFSKDIGAGFRLLENGPLADEAKRSIEKILGISNIDLSKPEEIAKAIDKLGLSSNELYSRMTRAGDSFKTFSNIVNNSASSLSSFKLGLAETAKLVGDMNNELLPKDNVGKIGIQLIADSHDLSIALQDPIHALAALKNLANDTKTLSLLPANTAKELITVTAEIKNITTRLAEAQDKLAKVKSVPIQEIKNTNNINNPEAKWAIENINRISKEANTKRQLDIENAEKIVSMWKQASVNMASTMGASLDKVMFTAGVDHLTRSMNVALQNGAITAAKGYLSVLKMAGGATAQSEGNLEQESLNIQLALIKSNYDSVVAQERGNILQEEANLLLQKSMIDLKGSARDAALAPINKQLAGLEARKMIVDLAPKTQMALLKTVGKTEGIPEDIRNAVKSLSGLFSANAGRVQQEAGINAQKVAGAATTKANVTIEGGALSKDRLVTAKGELDTRLAINAEARKLVGIYTEANQTEKQNLEFGAAAVNYAIAQSDSAAKLLVAEQAIQQYKKGSKDYVNAQKAADDQRAKMTQEYGKYVQETSERESRHLEEQFVGKESIRQIDATRYSKLLKDSSDLSNIEITNSEAQLSSLEKLGYINDIILIGKRASLELSKQDNAYTVERNTLEEAYVTTRNRLEQDKLAAENDKQDTSHVTKLLKDASEEHARQLQILERKNAVATSSIVLAKETNIELAKQKEFTENILTLTVSLALVFGKVGAAIGGALAVINKMAIKETQYAKQKFDLEKKREKLKDAYSEDPKDIEDIAKAKVQNAEQLMKLEQDTAISQLNNISAISAAGKQMFDEKTAAYKAFDVIQKVTAAASMAIQVQQMAADMAALPGKIAGGVATLFKQGGWAGFAGAAAFLAMMASLGAGGNSATAAPTSGTIAKDLQETQGTGTSWKDGKKVENGGGVFGDSEAKSASIVNSLEVIKDNTITGLRYDTRMLKALESIDKGVNSTAKSIYNIPGIRQGSITGREDISTSTSGIKGLFGKSTTEEIINSGLELSGTFTQMAKSGSGLVKSFETVFTTVNKGGFLGIGASTKTSTTTRNSNVPPEVEQEVSDIFAYAQNLFTVIGKKIGITGAEVVSKLNNIDLGKAFVSLRGLKGEELEKEFNAVISSIMDSAAGTIFGTMKKYANFGEGLLETTVRVTDSFDKVKIGLSSVGISTSETVQSVVNVGRAVSNLFGKNMRTQIVMQVEKFNYEVTEAIINAVGGLDIFTDQIKFFSENFLTEEERLAPVMKNVTSTLSEMGLAFVDTRDEFKFVIQSLDLTTESGRDIYATMMGLAEAFTMAYPVIGEVSAAEEKLNKYRSQYVDILKLEKKLVQATALERELELAAMEDYLRIGQQYIWAMEDVVSLSEEATAAYEKESSALKDTIQLLDSQVDALNKYKQSLKTGAQSILTPQDKYKETKIEAMRVAAIANGIAVTEAEKQAKNQAISELPTAASAFLDASRMLYASSVQYTADYDAVLAVVTTTSNALSEQKSMAEKQLDALEQSYSALNIIAESTYSLAQITPLLLAAQERSAAAAIAYYAQVPPTAVVAPVISTGVSEETKAAVAQFNNNLAVAELQNISNQLAQLRAEQEAQAVEQAKLTAATAAITANAAEAAKAAAAAEGYRLWQETLANNIMYNSSTGGF